MPGRVSRVRSLAWPSGQEGCTSHGEGRRAQGPSGASWKGPGLAGPTNHTGGLRGTGEGLAWPQGALWVPWGRGGCCPRWERRTVGAGCCGLGRGSGWRAPPGGWGSYKRGARREGPRGLRGWDAPGPRPGPRPGPSPGPGLLPGRSSLRRRRGCCWPARCSLRRRRPPRARAVAAPAPSPPARRRAPPLPRDPRPQPRSLPPRAPPPA